ncbi:MAG: aconitate hydratase AcnA [Sandaracinaceae bacterium]|nr:aconitate hydratase AcnA [Sandaracinaceae bacterium]
MANTGNSFNSRATLNIGGREIDIFRLDALTKAKVGDVATLPFSIRILLENLLRREDGKSVFKEHIEAVAKWDPTAEPSQEIAFTPARALLQDFTGVPAVVDLAAMREALTRMGGDATKVNPLQPADLVIDHSVQVDSFGTLRSFDENVKLEFERNQERYQFLRWGQSAFKGFRVVPPGTGIVHQVNLEYLASVVFTADIDGRTVAYPDTLVGTDSHTTMINGLGVLGWGVGGIEAEAAMLGQPVAMLLPQVIGFKLTGKLREGTTATDLVLTVTEMLRKKGVVGKFVEFYGSGIDAISLPDRATIANMAPEYGATMGFFPVDAETLAFLRFSGRDPKAVELVERYCKEQGLFRTAESPEPRFTDTLGLDLGDVVPSIAGPKRPQDRIALTDAKKAWRKSLVAMLGTKLEKTDKTAVERWLGEGGQPAEEHGSIYDFAKVKHPSGEYSLTHGAVVIAAITSCTNTSNPSVMLGAGLVAKKALEKGLSVKPWVKTSLAPGSQVVTEYYKASGLNTALDALGFNLVGYGCTTCIGNSGPVPDDVATAIKDKDLVVSSVLSGNRNFEGRVNPVVRANFLASPPLVVAYALAGTTDIDFDKDPIGNGKDGKPVFLRDIWPTQKEVTDTVRSAVQTSQFESRYAEVFKGPEQWQSLVVPTGATFAWDPKSTYIRKPSFFEDMTLDIPPPPSDITGARALAILGDSITTDHISPAGNIAKDSPAAKYLTDNGVAQRDFNQYGARRGNHEVMLRGTFANIRLRNEIMGGAEGGNTKHFPDAAPMSIYDAAMQYKAEGTPLVIVAGKEYGSGSSRDWAAKGTFLLGVKAVIAESYERIHRSNLVGMGVLPLEFTLGQTRLSLGLTGTEIFEITGISSGLVPGKMLTVKAADKNFQVRARVDTPQEIEYLLHGGILQYVLRSLAKA